MTDPWAFGWTQVLTVIGFAITIAIAVSGFRSFGRWRREKVEERRIEIALDMLSLAYESKYVFQTIRSPMSFEYEWEDMPRALGEEDRHRGTRGPFYATLRRINLHKEFFEKGWKLHPRCVAVFGNEADEIFLLMHRARREIEVSAQMLVGDTDREIDRSTRDQFQRDVWEMGDNKSDRVGRKLTDFIARTGHLCRPIIGRRFRPNGA
jgi:hypothetical protein